MSTSRIFLAVALVSQIIFLSGAHGAPSALKNLTCADSKYDPRKNPPVWLEAATNAQGELRFDLGNLEPIQGSVYKRSGVSGLFQITQQDPQSLELTGSFGTKLVLSSVGVEGKFNGSLEGLIDVIVTPGTATRDPEYEMDRVSKYPLDCVVQ